MCGIAGIFQNNGSLVAPDLLRAIGDTMTHRGPDNFGFVVFEKIGMTHNRLSLLDLSAAANQPFQNSDYILSYNGEIYNFQAIRKRLENDYGIDFKTTSDTEVLFHSLINDGVEACLKEIKGMFAFAFYDKRKSELWLARDRMGIKPLYYIQHKGGFYWSSEIKALIGNLDVKLDPVKALFSIGGLGERSKENTLFRGLYSVKPGSFLKVDSTGKTRETIYYSALDDFDLDYYRELERQTPSEITDRFESLFVGSVERMLICDAPMGVFVSGGVDSSLIAAVARQRSPDVKLFTANVVGKFSEYADALEVSKHIGAELNESKFEPEMMLSDWADVTYYYESPIVVHTNAIPFARVARLARDMKVKAVLTGEGADELFLGYPRLLTRRYNTIALFPDKVLKSLYKLVPGLTEYLFPTSNNNVANFVGQLAQKFESQRLDEYGDKFDFLNKEKKDEQKMTVKMINEHLVTLLHRNDRMGMMSSIEARFPFLDEDIVKFAVNLPSKFKIGRSRRFHNYKHPFLIDKWILRKIAEKYLPNHIANKKKFGFEMAGHKYTRVDEKFFKDGWLGNCLDLDDASVEYFVRTQNPYFLGKLASVEIFGRIFGLGEKPDDVRLDVMRYIRMDSANN